MKLIYFEEKNWQDVVIIIEKLFLESVLLLNLVRKNPIILTCLRVFIQFYDFLPVDVNMARRPERFESHFIV
jgi:hypothetical protein